MKCVLLALGLAVAVAAAPDDLFKLEQPSVISSSIIGAESDTATAAPVDAPKTKLVTSKQGSVEDRTRLLAKLFKGYNKKVNPDNVKLNFGVTLIDFSVIEKRDVLDLYAWLKYEWEDSRLKWDPEEFGGAQLIRIEASDVWKPDVTLYNSADPVNMVNCWESNILIYSTGKMLWVPPCKMSAQCHFDLRKHPYGEQTCMLKFGSWTFDGYILDIQFYNKTAGLDLSDLNNSSGFEIVSTSAVRNEKFYSCCVEPYPDVTFNVTVKRIPGEELIKKMH